MEHEGSDSQFSSNDENHGEQPEYLKSPQERAKEIDPEVLPVYERLYDSALALANTDTSARTMEQQHEVDALWARFVDLVTEGKRVNPFTLLELETPMSLLGRQEDVRFLRRHWLSITPQSSEALNMFAFEEWKVGNLEVAEELLQQSIESQKKSARKFQNINVDALEQLPLHELQLHQNDIGWSMLDIAFAYGKLAEIQMQRSRFPEAEGSADLAVKWSQVYASLPFADHLATAGEARLRIGKNDEGRGYLLKALERHRRSYHEERSVDKDLLTSVVAVKALLHVSSESELLKDFFDARGQIETLLTSSELHKFSGVYSDLLQDYANLRLLHYFGEIPDEVLHRPLTPAEHDELIENFQELVSEAERLTKVLKNADAQKNNTALRLIPRHMDRYLTQPIEASLEDVYWYYLGKIREIFVAEFGEEGFKQFSSIFDSIDNFEAPS